MDKKQYDVHIPRLRFGSFPLSLRSLSPSISAFWQVSENTYSRSDKKGRYERRSILVASSYSFKQQRPINNCLVNEFKTQDTYRHRTMQENDTDKFLPQLFTWFLRNQLNRNIYISNAIFKLYK